MKALSEMKEGGNMSKRREQQSVIADEQIIELYWQRNENAIQETDKKYGKFLYRIITILEVTEKMSIFWTKMCGYTMWTDQI